MAIPPLVEPVARLSTAESARTASHGRLPQLNELGQRRLANARVLVIGTGRLGVPALRCLATAGIGTIGIVDGDDVEAGDAQHRIVLGAPSVAGARSALAAESIAALAPEATVVLHAGALTPGTAAGIIGDYDVVIDGSDGFPTRFLANDTCAELGLPLVWASVLRLDAQLSVFWARPPAESGLTGVSLRDLFPAPPAEGDTPRCAEAGVLGALCGQAGSLMAAEAIKLITGVGAPLIGRVLVIDALSGSFTEAPLRGTGVPARAGAEPADLPADSAGREHDCSPGGACATPADARTVREQLEAVLSVVRPLPGTRVPLSDALGLVLAEDVRTATDIPPFDNSAMDGYAVRRNDLLNASPGHPVALRVIADLAAGTAENPLLRVGLAARIMTGAPIPDGADAVVPLEEADRGHETVSLSRPPRPAAHIRRAGEDARAGDTVLLAGMELWPTRIAAAASAGASWVFAHPAPRVAIVSTGSELVPPGHATGRGQIPDSNSFLLAAAVAGAGGVPIRLGAVPDDEDTLRELLAAQAGTVDAIVLSGGVSVGDFDVVKAVLERLGTVRFGPVRMQPGKPQGFGRWPDGPVIFALPGNPVSAFVSFEAFVRPALRRMQGHTELHRRIITATVVDGWDSPSGRAQYMPAIIELHEAGARVSRATSGGAGSHLVAGLGLANGLALVPEGVTRIDAGDLVTVMLTS